MIDQPTCVLYQQAVDLYRALRPEYDALAGWLKERLDHLCDTLGVAALVQGRTKEPASFAEKLIRKGYDQPFARTVDLCGLRIICPTLGQVETVCSALRDQNRPTAPGLRVVEEESGDKRERLGPREFGYLSVHLVVELDEVPGSLAALRTIRERTGQVVRAEVQVRTILQHAWAEIEHDLGYKLPMDLPAALARQFASLAAVLENADQAFDIVRAGLEERIADELTTPDRDSALAEVGRLCAVRDVLKQGELEVDGRLVGLYKHLQRWDDIVTLLGGHDRGQLPAPLLRDLGLALCKTQRRQPFESSFLEGQALLEQAARANPGDPETLANLAASYRDQELWAKRAGHSSRQKEARRQARDAYRRAWEQRPGHSYSLGNYLEYLITDEHDPALLEFFVPSLRQASEQCRRQIAEGVNLPWAWFDLGKFALLQQWQHSGDPEAPVRHYARGLRHASSSGQVQSALRTFETLEQLPEKPAVYADCRRLLEMGERAWHGSPGEGPAEVVVLGPLAGERLTAVLASLGGDEIVAATPLPPECAVVDGSGWTARQWLERWQCWLGEPRRRVVVAWDEGGLAPLGVELSLALGARPLRGLV